MGRPCLDRMEALAEADGRVIGRCVCDREMSFVRDSSVNVKGMGRQRTGGPLARTWEWGESMRGGKTRTMENGMGNTRGSQVRTGMLRVEVRRGERERRGEWQGREARGERTERGKEGEGTGGRGGGGERERGRGR
ncbi:hypothetical protein CBR_g21225 [Chara braunii]|uniref:Uncharacterized protein n=1 Tax=Chara braunii TaxID=69332 RepID=A0A388L195_CHABU|nr:hypothetical protein CBR_g21225 [Chara braunii]|eukprot:GBG75983.1 hypothetical protein CBR_g21225 [Chara braunii]